jgi:hypothetical protein
VSHFEIGEWADYVRGIAGDPGAGEISAHLNAGCSECLETYTWLKEVSVVANLSVSVEIPERVIRRAEGLFDFSPELDFSKLLPLNAQMIFDAGRVSHPVGIRTGGATDQALYEAGEYVIDLRHESVRGSAQISLVGQISSVTNSSRDDLRFPVALFAGRSLLSRAVTNAFGEFSLTYTRRPDLRLAIAMREAGQRIELSITNSNRRITSRVKDK